MSSSTMPICIEVRIPYYIKIDSNKFLNNEDDTSPPPINIIAPISGPLPQPPPKTPSPRPKLAMITEEERSFISKLLNDPSNFPLEAPIKETIGKLVLICTKDYALVHPSIPLIFDYVQHG